MFLHLHRLLWWLKVNEWLRLPVAPSSSYVCMCELFVVGLDTTEREGGGGNQNHGFYWVKVELEVHLITYIRYMINPRQGWSRAQQSLGEGREDILDWSPSQDASIHHLILFFRQNAGSNKDLQSSPKPQRTKSISVCILLGGCDANLDATLMYFPPLTVSLMHQKAFKPELKPDKSFTGVIWQRSTAHYLVRSPLNPEVLPVLAIDLFSKLPFSTCLKLFHHQRFSDTAQKQELRFQENQQ